MICRLLYAFWQFGGLPAMSITTPPKSRYAGLFAGNATDIYLSFLLYSKDFLFAKHLFMIL
jgi:hypothetical protein